MRRLLAILAVLVSGSAFATQTVPKTSTDATITPHVTACFDTLSTAKLYTTDTTGNTYKCVSGKWERADLPPCPANPPTGACPGTTFGNAICKTTNAATIYGCDGSGNWANMSGSGATPSGSTGDIQRNSSGSLGTVPGFTGDGTTGAVTAKIFNEVRYSIRYSVTGTGTSGDPYLSADGTAGIQAANDSCPSTGCKIIVPRGVSENSTSVFLKSGVWLSGDGMGVSIIKRKALTQDSGDTVLTGAMIQAGSAAGVVYTDSAPGASITITDLTLDGNYTAQSTTFTSGHFHGIRFGKGIGGTPFGNVDGVTIKGVEVKNTLQDGIYITNAKNVLITSCITYKTGQIAATTSKNGITLTGDSSQKAAGWLSNGVVSNNRVSYSGDATVRGAEGIASVDWDNLTISGNDISHVDYGIELNNATSALTLSNYSITGNTIHDLVETTTFGGFGITFPSVGVTSRYSNVSITGNSFFNLYTAAINASRLDGFAISGNVARKTNTQTLGTSDKSIMAVGCHDGSITGNTVTFVSPVANPVGIAVQGIVGTDTTDGIVVSGNSVIDVPVSASSYGILLSSDATGVLVSGNKIVGGGTGVGINATGTNSGNFVSDNVISGATLSTNDTSGQTNTTVALTTNALTLTTVNANLVGGVTAGSGKTINSTSGTLRIPNSTALPATCTVGDEYMDTDASSGGRHFLCESTNTWKATGISGSLSVNGVGVSGPNLTSTGDVAFVVAGSDVTGNIVAGSLVNADINAAAAIDVTKLGTFTSAQLAALLTNESGSGSVLFGINPAITTPTIDGWTPNRCFHSNSLGVMVESTGDCATGGGGTVSSVGWSGPSDFSVSGSPVTGSSTIAVTWAAKAPNLFLAGPTSGGSSTPTFRAFNALDCATAPFLGTAGTTGCVPPPNAGDLSPVVKVLGANGTWVTGTGLSTTGTPAITQIARFGASGTSINGLSTALLDDSGNMTVASLSTAVPANGSRRAKLVGNTTDPTAPANTDAYFYAKSASLTDGLQLPFWRNATTGVIKILNDVGGDYGEFTCTAGVCGLDDNVVVGADIGIGTTIGDTLYYNGTDWVRLGNGTTGQVLGANTGAAPSWGAAGTINNNVTFTMNGIATGDTGIVHIPAASTITRIACYTVGGGTSVATVNVNKRAQATPATSGTDVTTTAYTCDTTTVNTAQTLNSTAITAGNWLALTFGTVTGTANLVVSVDYTTP